jgi:glycosyltransferase involved in cell wall biosynthesis
MASKQTIGLNMIVRNEAHLILDSLEKLTKKIQFDYWCISDTGSTDGTQSIIREFFAKKQINGELVEHEWRFCVSIQYESR